MINLQNYSSEWKRKCGIYCISNLVNNKVYVGSSTELKMRWFSHIRELNFGRHRNDHLQKAWNKYGKDSFCIEVLEICDGKDLVDLANKENYWMEVLDSLNRDKGYNIDCAGDLHRISEETKTKISKANKGHIHSEETKQKIRVLKIGVKHTTESRRNMSVAINKRWASGWRPSPESVKIQADKRRGQKHTEETKKRLSEISKANNKSKRSIIMMDLNGKFLKSFNSIVDAARFVNAQINKGSNSHIVDACSGRKKVAYGYKWQYSVKK